MPFDRPHLLAVLMLLLVAFSTSCGDSGGNSAHAPTSIDERTEPAAHNTADVNFARNMIPHHQQAVVLAAMVPTHTANAELRVMATHIGADQQSEIRTLDNLLAEWGERPVDTHAAHHDDGMPMMGMVDQATLDRLGTLDDNAFDTLWVTSMISHHQGAVAMAQDEIAHGESRDAVHVATLIVAAQQREIAMMTHLISSSQ